MGPIRGQIVTPLPSIGDAIAGRDVAGRELRISGHPESDRLVLSIWQSGRCLATVRLARADVPEVTRALVASLVPAAAEPEPEPPWGSPDRSAGRFSPATVHDLLGSRRPDERRPGALGDGLRELGRRLRRFTFPGDPRD
jgi:hypothetical protein